MTLNTTCRWRRVWASRSGSSSTPRTTQLSLSCAHGKFRYRTGLTVRDALLNTYAGFMTDVRTSRLQLHPIDASEGERIVAKSPAPDDLWADDFPFDGDVGAVGSFLHATAEGGEQTPFGFYRITSLADGRAIGGIGFKGKPNCGCVEVGYGLAPSARGHGYAAEALIALVAMAADNRVSRVIADTTRDNIASQRTLIRAGFRLLGTDDELHHYQLLLNIGH